MRGHQDSEWESTAHPPHRWIITICTGFEKSIWRAIWILQQWSRRQWPNQKWLAPNHLYQMLFMQWIDISSCWAEELFWAFWILEVSKNRARYFYCTMSIVEVMAFITLLFASFFQGRRSCKDRAGGKNLSSAQNTKRMIEKLIFFTLHLEQCNFFISFITSRIGFVTYHQAKDAIKAKKVLNEDAKSKFRGLIQVRQTCYHSRLILD